MTESRSRQPTKGTDSSEADGIADTDSERDDPWTLDRHNDAFATTRRHRSKATRRRLVPRGTTRRHPDVAHGFPQTKHLTFLLHIVQWFTFFGHSVYVYVYAEIFFFFYSCTEHTTSSSLQPIAATPIATVSTTVAATLHRVSNLPCSTHLLKSDTSGIHIFATGK